jgi:SPP1 gp7 family putative phage head morphogenesis protein
LQQNIYQFSGAKTYQQLKRYNSFLIDENGKERSFNAFKQLVLAEHPKYNKNYLEAEFQTARASGQMAEKWQGFLRNQERYPNLKYRTVGDEHVRDDHRTLDGFTAAIDDPIWDKIYPPNDWRCRCSVSQTNSETTPEAERPDTKFMKPEFEVNVGKTGEVFSKAAHPYYVMPKKDQDDYRLAFESMKLRLSYGKAKYNSNSGAKVFVHPFAHNEGTELIENYKVAKILSDKEKLNVHIQPHVDGHVISRKNPEYKIKGKLAERKAPFSTNYKKSLKKANDQECEIVVFDLSRNKDTIKNAQARIHNVLKHQGIHKFIKEVYIISSDGKTTKHYKRKKQS